MELHGYMIAIW